MSDDLRTGLARTGDSRAIDTRRRLAEAFTQAAEQQIAYLSVVRICEIAKVGRSTFYTHFATVDDLAVWMIDDLFGAAAPTDVARRTAHRLDLQDITRRSLEQLVWLLWNSRVLVSYAVALPTGQTITQRIIADVAGLNRAAILAERPSVDEGELRLLSNYFAGGFVQLALTWLAEPTVSLDRVVDQLFEVLPPWINGHGSADPDD